MRNTIRIFRRKLEQFAGKSIADDERKKLEDELRKVVSIISHVASKGIIHKNEAKRRISRIMKFFNKVVSMVESH